MVQKTLVTVAIIGVGSIGPRHAKSVVQCTSTRLLCFVDPSEHSRQVAQTFDVPLFESIERMLRAGITPDAAIVCTPNDTHVTIGVRLLESGIHILVEKPVSTTAREGQILVCAAETSGQKLLVGHHRRFNPFIAATKNALQQNAIGRPIAISGTWCAYKPPEYFAQAMWRTKQENGGPILINLIHEIDLLHYLLGPISRVYAEQTVSHRSHQVEEGAAITIRFTSGVVGTFLISDAAPSLHNLESATGENPMIPCAGKDFYRIFGSEGTLSVGDMKVTRHREEQAKSWTEPMEEERIPVEHRTAFDAQIEHFVEVIQSKQAPRCSGTEALQAVVVCECIKRSMK